MNKEEILLNKANRETPSDDYTIHCSLALSAMQEYADQETSSLRKEVEELQSELDHTKRERDTSFYANAELVIENTRLEKELEELKEQNMWVPVSERLPEKDGRSEIYCLVKTINNGVRLHPYSEYHKCWDTEDGDDYFCDAVGGKITHWRPLPSPPDNKTK